MVPCRIKFYTESKKTNDCKFVLYCKSIENNSINCFIFLVNNLYYIIKQNKNKIIQNEIIYIYNIKKIINFLQFYIFYGYFKS